MEYLAIRICSPQKDFTANSLSGIYTNPMLQAFFRKMKHIGLNYGVFSRKHGIQRESNNHQAYPSIEEIPDNQLLNLLKSQFEDFKDIIFLYWNHRPLTHTKYVNMMRLAGFTVIELRVLNDFEKYKNGIKNDKN
jgi:hypothetical protein